MPSRRTLTLALTSTYKLKAKCDDSATVPACLVLWNTQISIEQRH